MLLSSLKIQKKIICDLTNVTFVWISIVQFFPVMVGDIDNTGSLNAQIIHQISSRIRSKVVFQVKLTLLSLGSQIDCFIYLQT